MPSDEKSLTDGDGNGSPKALRPPPGSGFRPKIKKGRGKDGLTDKMRESIPVIAVAKSIYRGLLDCVEQGIISATNYYYAWWGEDKEPGYQKLLDAERNRVQGMAHNAVVQRFKDHAEDHADVINALAYNSKNDAVRLAASRAALAGMGVTTGQAQINVTAGASASVNEKQGEFCVILEREFQKRIDFLSSEDS